ncbi:hypothetical protein [Ahrensia sp. 13_GOM-1096m]
MLENYVSKRRDRRAALKVLQNCFRNMELPLK